MALNSSTVNVGDVATATQYNNARKDIVQYAGDYVTSTGSANAYVVAVDAQIVTAYVERTVIKFKANFTNTGSATLNVNSLGAKTIKKYASTNLAAGDIQSGDVVAVIYDGTNFQLLTPVSQDVLSGTTQTAGENLSAGEVACMESDTKAYKSVRKMNTFAQYGSFGQYQSPDLIYLSDGRVASVYIDATGDLYCVACSVSRLTATPGSAVGETTGTYRLPRCCLIDTDKIIAITADTTDSDKLYGVVFTISGTTPTAGTRVKIDNTVGADNDTYSVCKLDTDKFLVTYRDATADDPIGVVCTVSGTTITAGTRQVLESGITMTGATLCGQFTTNDAIALWDNGTNIRVASLSISGTVITIGTVKSLYTGEITDSNANSAGIITIDKNNILLYAFDSASSKFIFTLLGKTAAGGTVDYSSVNSSSFDVNNWNTSSGFIAVTYLGNNKIAILLHGGTGYGSVIFRVVQYAEGGFQELFCQEITQANIQEMALAKLNTIGTSAIAILRDSTLGQLKYAVYLNTESQVLGIVKTTTTATNPAPITTRGSIAVTGVTAGNPYFVADAGAVATTGTKQIGVGTATDTLFLN